MPFYQAFPDADHRCKALPFQGFVLISSFSASRFLAALPSLIRIFIPSEIFSLLLQVYCIHDLLIFLQKHIFSAFLLLIPEHVRQLVFQVFLAISSFFNNFFIIINYSREIHHFSQIFNFRSSRSFSISF